jgi:beta-N-acetylhexosaminidase
MRRRRWLALAVTGCVLSGALVAACSSTPAATATTRSTTTGTLRPGAGGTHAAHQASGHGPGTTDPSCLPAQVVAGWSVARRAAQLVVVPVEETDVEAAAVSMSWGPGGLILFGDSAPDDLGSELHGVTSSALDGVPLLVMTDEEGGEVQRMANLVGELPWARTMAKTMSTGQVQALATQVATKMLAAGVTVDLAPDLDLASGPGPDAIHTDGPRSFSPTRATATAYGEAFLTGLEAGGVLPVIKHFPGEGSATANTDDAPASTPPLSTLQGADLLPFAAAIKAGAPAVMVGNATVPGLTATPASLSEVVIGGLLRGQLGFHGLVLTDSLSAGAIADIGISVPTAAVQAVAAGVDMVLYQSDTPDTTGRQIVAALVAAVADGTISTTQLDAAVLQVLQAKKVSLCPG